MAKTNSGLVAYAKAQLKKPYWYGCYGQKASKALYTAKKKQYPKYYKWSYSSAVSGKKVHDCAGLIKGYLWSSSPTAAAKYNSKQDFGATGFYNHAKKKSTIKSFDKVAGRLVFKGKNKTMKHVGVYIGGGYVIEAKGHNYGVVKTKLAGGGWTHWAQCHLISEDPKKVETPATPATSTKPVDSVTPKPAPKPVVYPTYKVTAKSGLNVRTGPGVKYKKLKTLKKNTKVKILEQKNGWGKIAAAQWVAMNYLKKI